MTICPYKTVFGRTHYTFWYKASIIQVSGCHITYYRITPVPVKNHTYFGTHDTVISTATTK